VNALAVAAEMLGDLELSSGQLAQLRALDRKYAQRVYTLLHDSDGAKRDLTELEAAGLRAQLESDITDLLTAEQRNLSS
jgi:hypothetical protein